MSETVLPTKYVEERAHKLPNRKGTDNGNGSRVANCKLELKMAFARHNIEKRRLIELVRLNPILWDCRLPHYKRSDKKKAVKWNELGRIFSVNGERVQRTFTSLREIFRRELNHEKLLGSRFKSKWEYYDEMAFLKEVIRERKSRERVRPTEVQQNNNNSSTGIDEYQYFAPNDPNNPNNEQQQLPQALPDVASNIVQAAQQQNQQAQHQLQPLQLQPDVILGLNASALSTLQQLSTNGLQSHQQQLQNQSQQPAPQHSPSHALSTTHSTGSTSPSIYIKDEPDSQDDTISLATTTHNEKLASAAKTQNSPIKLVKNRNSNVKNSNLRATNAKSKSLHIAPANCLVIDDELADADIDDDPNDIDLIDDAVDERMSVASTVTAVRQHHPSVREILYTKFGDFLAARLNTLHETVANDLMNRILLLIAEK